MPSLKSIRQRINAVGKIKQITKSMEMIAASRLKRTEDKLLRSQNYSSKLIALIGHLDKPDLPNPFMTERPIKKTGLVIISSNRGLCGSYNSNLFSEANEFLSRYNKDQIELILLGRKAAEHYRRKPWTIKDQRVDWDKNINYAFAEELAKDWIAAFLEGKLDEIWVVHTHYINVLSRKILIDNFFKFIQPTSQQNITPIDYILEPNVDEIYREALPRFFANRIFTMLLDAFLAEQAARLVSMQTATKNADEMIDYLTLVRNKVRQANITKEISEIISGAARS